MSLQCRRMPSFLAIADFLRPQSLELGSTFIYGVRISFESFSGVQKARAVSAGTEPGVCVHPEVQAVMQEVGIDLSNAKPEKLTEELAGNAQLLITMGCGDQCPYVPGLRRDDWPLKDPKGLPIEDVRVIRDEVKGRVEELLRREGLD
jgi:arsenate reductase (thioredoxin)